MNRRGDGDGDNDDPGKLFIGGLTWDTEDDHMKAHFAQYGEISDVHVMMDKHTSKSRCFGFLTFKDPASADLAISSGPHFIKDKKVDAKKCNKKAAAAARRGDGGERNTKVFVGGLPSSADEDALKLFFGDFGVVSEAVIVIDPATKRTRGFGFVTFESAESVEKVCKLKFHNMQGKQIECKFAQPRVPGMGRSAPGAQEQGGWGMQNAGGGFQQEGWNQGGGGGYGSGYNMSQSYGYGQQQQQPYSGGYGQQQQQPTTYGGGGYDYSNMGGGYAQQQTNYGPDRSGYGAQQNASYGAQTGGYAGYSAGYGTDQSAGYAAAAGYTGVTEQSYGQQPSTAASHGYHPYGR